MTWLVLFVGFCAGTVTTAVLMGLLLMMQEEDQVPEYPPYDWMTER